MHFVRKLHVVQEVLWIALVSSWMLCRKSNSVKPFCHLRCFIFCWGKKKFHVVTHLFSPLSCMASFIALTTAKDKVAAVFWQEIMKGFVFTLLWLFDLKNGCFGSPPTDLRFSKSKAKMTWKEHVLENQLT